jgi:hypothetical protein
MKMRSSGEVAAALFAVWIGLAGMAASHLWSVWDPLQAEPVLLKLGSWIPGWQGIGPYAGKETIGLAGWMSSWLILHVIFRGINVNLRWCLYGFIAGMFVLTAAIFPPVYHAVLGWRY